MNPLGPILISVLKLGPNLTKRCIINKMVSVIQEKEERKGKGLEELSRHHYNYKDYLQMESSAYSLFVLATRSPQTKQKHLQRLGIFLILFKLQQEKQTQLRSAVIS